MVLWSQRLLARVRWAMHSGRILDERSGIGVGGVVDVLLERRHMGWRGVRYGNTRLSNRRGTYEHHAEQRTNTKRCTIGNF